MKVTLVTISFDYGDYFSLSAHFNRPLVDRIVVVTPIDDKETLQAAKRERCESLVVARTVVGRANFNPVDQKAYFLNRALMTVPEGEWTLLLDADTILPPDFRARLEEQDLTPGFLYGVEGRRMVDDEEDFLASYDGGPWRERVERCSGILGFFSLFVRTSVRDQLPTEPHPGHLDNHHNDHAHAMSYPPEKRELMPFQVIHLGENRENWEGRQSERFEGMSLLKQTGNSLKDKNSKNLECVVECLEKKCGTKKVEDAVFISGEIDLRDLIIGIYEEVGNREDLVAYGRGFDHKFHPITTTAIVFILGIPDVIEGEAWGRVLGEEDFVRIGEFSRLLKPVSPMEEVVVLAFGEGISSLEGILMMRSMKKNCQTPLLFFSGERAAELEIEALRLGFHLLTGQLVSHEAPSYEERVCTRLMEEGYEDALVVCGPAREVEQDKLRRVIEEGRGIRTVPAQKLAVSERRYLSIGELAGLFREMQLFAITGNGHFIIDANEYNDNWLLALASWRPAQWTIHLCKTERLEIELDLETLLGRRVKLHKHPKEKVFKNFSMDDRVVLLPNLRICQRTAVVPTSREPDSRELDRLGWMVFE